MTEMCANEITISGPTETIKKLWDDAHELNDPKNSMDELTYALKYAKDVRGLFNAMVPMPEEIKGDKSEKWCTENWGTMDIPVDGNFKYVDSGDGTSIITGCFDTAWGPPVKSYTHFINKNINCSIEADYEKEDADFAGLFIDGDDQFIDGIYGYCKAVIEGSCALEDTPELFQRLEARLGLIERREEEIEEEIEEKNKQRNRVL